MLATLPIQIALIASLPLFAAPSNAPTGLPNIDGAAGRQVFGSDFKTGLKRGYEALARTLAEPLHPARERSDWADAQYFSLKAMAAEQGLSPAPEDISAWSISADELLELEIARDRLLHALARAQSKPRLTAEGLVPWLADAQVGFDCWVERSEEREDAKACRAAFEQALATAEAGLALNDMRPRKAESSRMEKRS